MRTSPNAYFQFPLCALTFGTTIDERLNAIVGYSCVTAGEKLFSKLSDHEKNSIFGEIRATWPVPVGFDQSRARHRAAICGLKGIGVTYPRMENLIAHYEAMNVHIQDFERKHGRDAMVRVKTAWLFKVRDGKGLTYREFAVLCGIYSILGDKNFVRITQDRIRRAALGYRSDKVLRSAMHERGDGAIALTERKLRGTIERLHRNKFFARCTVSRRSTYYSNRLGPDKLRMAILEKHTYATRFHNAQSEMDAALTEAIKHARAPVMPNSPSTSV